MEGEKNAINNVIEILNLVRPFTQEQLKELLSTTGNIAEKDAFWINQIKSHAIVKFSSPDDAQRTIKSLNGTQWPPLNPKKLIVQASTKKKLEDALGNNKKISKNDTKENAKYRENGKIISPSLNDKQNFIVKATSVDIDRTKSPDETKHRKVILEESEFGKTGLSKQVPESDEQEHLLQNEGRNIMNHAKICKKPKSDADGEKMKYCKDNIHRDKLRSSSKSNRTNQEKYLSGETQNSESKTSKIRLVTPNPKEGLDHPLSKLFRKTKAYPPIYWLPKQKK